MGKALYEESIKNDSILQVCSMYDETKDAVNNLYFPSENFKGFGINKFRFTREMVQSGAKYDTVILSHINLLPVGWLIKKISLHTKLILLAHGIEVWQPLSPRKRKMLQQCDSILAVSTYTRDKIINLHGVPNEKCAVLNNCLDPFLSLPLIHKKEETLLKRYGYTPDDIIIMTLTRLSSKERYKGYDKVIEAIAVLKEKYPNIKYFLAGKYDQEEKIMVDRLIQQKGLEDNILLPGYIKDEELADHFAMSDLYIMPSKGEGFGIVFIEAMYYGLPVIAGNIDGSADALLQGELGQLVNPYEVDEIANAITNIIENKILFSPDRKLLMERFSYEVYKQKLENLTLGPFKGITLCLTLLIP